MEEFWSLRRERGGKIAGVCAALATRWQVDPLVVRIGAVLLGLSAGLGVVLYVFAWALLPAEDDPESPVQRHTPRLAQQSREFWLVAAVISAVVVAVSLGQLAPLGISPALVVLAVWYFGFRRPQQRARRAAENLPGPRPVVRDPFAGPDTPFTTAAREWQRTVLHHRAGSPPVPPHPTPAYPTPSYGAHTPSGTSPTPASPAQTSPGPTDHDPVRPEPVGRPWADPVPPTAPETRTGTAPPPSWPTGGPDELSHPGAEPAPRAETLSGHTAAVRSYLHEPDPAGLYAPRSSDRPGAARRRGRGTAVASLVVLVLAMAATATLDVLSPLPISLLTYLGAALLVTAAMLVVAAFTGRFRGQVLLTLVLLVATAITAAPSATARSADWQQPAVSYTTLAELPAGDAVDVGVLRADLSGLAVTEDASYRLSADAGRIELVLPPGTRVDLTTAVDVGSLSVDGQQTSGVDLSRHLELGPEEGPVLTVDARVDAGTLQVATP